MNKKFVIIGIVIIIAIIVIFALMHTTSTKYKLKINGQTIDMSLTDSKSSYYSTSFDIVNSNNYKSTYNIDFTDLVLADKNTTDSNEIIYDIAPPDEIISINGKTFECYIDNANNNATLHCKITDINRIINY